MHVYLIYIFFKPSSVPVFINISVSSILIVKNINQLEALHIQLIYYIYTS